MQEISIAGSLIIVQGPNSGAHFLGLPDAGVLLGVAHAGLLALGFAVGHALASATLPTLDALGAVGHVKADRAVGGSPGAQGLLFASGKVG